MAGMSYAGNNDTEWTDGDVAVKAAPEGQLVDMYRAMAYMLHSVPESVAHNIIENWDAAPTTDLAISPFYAWVWDSADNEQEHDARGAWYVLDAYWMSRIRHSVHVWKERGSKRGLEPTSWWQRSRGRVNDRADR